MSDTEHNLKPIIVVFKGKNPDQIRGKMIMPDTDPYKSDSNKIDIVFGNYWELLSNGIQPYLLRHKWMVIVSKKDPRIKFEACHN